MKAMKLGIQASRFAKLGEWVQPPEKPPLISAQRYLNDAVIKRKAETFKVFAVRVHCAAEGYQ